MSNNDNQDGCSYRILGVIGILVIISLIYFVLTVGVDWLQLTLLLEVIV